jgi:hypothetical protein
MSERDFEPPELDLDHLLSAERQRPEEQPEARDRVLARVHATLGLGGGGPEGDGPEGGGPEGGGPEGGGPGGGPSPTTLGGGEVLGPGGAASGGGGGAAATGIFGVLGKPLSIAIAALAVGAAGAGISASLPQASPSSIAILPALPPWQPGDLTPAPLKEASAPPPSGAARPPSDDAPDARIPAASASASRASPDAGPSVSHDTALAAERVLLETARAAVARGQLATAFDALERHAREFPRGRLGEEREGLWIQALLGAGRVDEARARFLRFRRSYPRSMLLPAFEASLAPNPVSETQRSP